MIPKARVVNLQMEFNIMSNDPVDGGLEGTGEEDWTI